MVTNCIYAADIMPLLERNAYKEIRPLLTAERQKKADRFIFEKDRLLCAAAGLLLDTALNENAVENRRICVGENGKPYLDGNAELQFNISHSKHLAVCAVSDRCVGIDAEVLQHFEDGLIDYICCKSESDYIKSQSEPDTRDILCTKLWTVKESTMKYFGTGLTLAPKEITIDMSGSEIKAACSRFDLSALSFTVIRHNNYFVTACSGYKEFSDKLRFITLPHGI